MTAVAGHPATAGPAVPGLRPAPAPAGPAGLLAGASPGGPALEYAALYPRARTGGIAVTQLPDKPISAGTGGLPTEMDSARTRRGVVTGKGAREQAILYAGS